MDRRDLLKAMTATGLALGPFAAMAQAEPPGGRWRRYESSNFVSYSAASEANARNEIAALEAFHGLLTKLMPSNRPRSPLKLKLYFAANLHDFQVTAPWAGSEVGGFYTNNLEEIRAVVAVSKGSERQYDVSSDARAFDPRLILFHEYVHHFMYANMRAAYPRWYVEGFAEYLSTAHFADKGVYLGKVTPARASWLISGEWLPIEKFLTGKVTTATDEAEFYAQAWLATHFFFNTPERAKGFDRYIAALTAGDDLLGAFEPAFGITPAAFDKELRNYRSKNIEFRLWPGITVNPAIPVTIQQLGHSADDLLMQAAYVRSRPGAKDGAASLKTIRALAKKYPDDPFAIRAQATAEIWLGDLGAARQLLDGLLKTDATNAETHHLNGLCELRSGYAAKDRARIVAAASSFATAHKLDATRASSMFRYVECNLQDRGEIDGDNLNVLIAAYQIAPQVDSIAMTLAHALMQQKRFEEAVIVLRPLASDAHGGDMSKKADEVIALALAGKPVGMAFFGAASGGGESD